MSNAIAAKSSGSSPAIIFLANIISWVFHPLLVGLYMTVYLVYVNPDYFVGIGEGGKIQTVLIYIINSIFFPLLSVLLCKALGFIQSVYLRTQRERIILYAITMIFFFWTFYVFKNKPGIPLVMPQMSLGIFFSVIICFIANIYTKISMHATAAGGLSGFFIVLLYTSSNNVSVALAVSVFIAGLVCSSRLIASAHRVPDIILGFGAGFISQWIAAWFIS